MDIKNVLKIFLYVIQDSIYYKFLGTLYISIIAVTKTNNQSKVNSATNWQVKIFD